MPPKRTRAPSFDYKTADLKDLRVEYEWLQKRLERKDAELEELRPKALPPSQLRDAIQTRISDAKQRQNDALTQINALIPEKLQNEISPLVAQLKEASQTAIDAKDGLIEYERKRAARHRTRAKQLRGMRNSFIGEWDVSTKRESDYTKEIYDLRARVPDFHIPGPASIRQEGEDYGKLKADVEAARNRLSNFYDRLTTGLDPYDIDDYDDDHEDTEDGKLLGQKILPTMEGYELAQIITRIEEQVNTVELQKSENRGKDQQINALQESRQVLMNQIKQAQGDAKDFQRQLKDLKRNPLYATTHNDGDEKEVIEFLEKLDSRKGQISREEQRLLDICKAKFKEIDGVWRKYFAKKKEVQTLTANFETAKASVGALERELRRERRDWKKKANQLEAQLAEQPAEQGAPKKKKAQEVDNSQDKARTAELEKQRRADLVAAQKKLEKCEESYKYVVNNYQDFRDQVKASGMTPDEQAKKIADLNKRISELDARNTELSDELDKAKAKLTAGDESQANVVDLNNRISVLTTRNTELAAELENAESTIKNLRRRENELKDKARELSKDQPSLGNNPKIDPCRKERDRILELERLLEEAEKKELGKASDDQCKEEKERINKLEKELEKAKERMRELKKELDEAKERMQDSKKENNDRAKEVSALMSGSKEVSQLEQISRLKEEISTLTRRAQGAEDERADLAEEVEQHTRRIETLQLALSGFTKEGYEEVAKPLKGQLQQKLEEREKALAQCNKNSDDLKKKLAVKTAEFDEIARKLATSTPKKGEIDCKAERKKIRILRKRLNLLKQDEAQLRDALESYSSIFKNKDKLPDGEILKKLRAVWKDHAALLINISMNKTYNSKSVSSSSDEHSPSEGSGKDKPKSPSQLAAKQKEIDELKEKLEECLKGKPKNAGLQEELAETRRSLKISRETVRGLTAQLDELKNNASATKTPTKTQNKDTAKKIARLEKEVKEAQVALAKGANVTTNTINREIARRREAETKLVRAVETRDAEIEKLEAKLKEAERERDRFEAERNEARDKYVNEGVEQLKANYKRIRIERDDLKKKNAMGGSSNSDKTELGAEIEKLNEKLQSQRDDYEKIQDGLKDELERCEAQRLKYDHDKAKKKLEKLRDELKKLEDERDEFKAQRDEFEKERNQARQEYNKMVPNLERYRAERNELQKQQKDKPNSPKQSTKELQKLSDKNAKLQADLEKCRADSDKWKEKANSLRQNLANDKQGLKAEVVALRKHRDAMQKEIVGPLKEQVATLIEQVAAASGIEPPDLLERAMDNYQVEPDNYPDEEDKDFRTREELVHMRAYVQQMGQEIDFLLQNELIISPEMETEEVEGEDEDESKNKSKKSPEREGNVRTGYQGGDGTDFDPGKPEDEEEPAASPVTQVAPPEKRKSTKRPDPVTPSSAEAKEHEKAGRGKRRRTQTERYSPTKYATTNPRSKASAPSNPSPKKRRISKDE